MKTLVVSLFVCALMIGLSSQGDAQVHFALGPKVGINFASASTEPSSPNISGRTTILFGSAFELMFGKMFGVQLEPGYAMKGFSVDNITVQSNAGPVAANAVVKYNEIQVPILFKAKFLDGPVKPYVLAGPNLGIVASAKATVSPAQGAQFEEQDIDIKESTSGMDFGLDFGGGAEFRLAQGVSLTGDVRYSLGLSNLDDSTPQQGQPQGSTKTRGFQIQFGALFSL
ncbi:MAG: porin family protein [Bacteroidota bacterium]